MRLYARDAIEDVNVSFIPHPFPDTIRKSKVTVRKKKNSKGDFPGFRIAITEQPFVRLERILIPQG